MSDPSKRVNRFLVDSVDRDLIESLRVRSRARKGARTRCVGEEEREERERREEGEAVRDSPVEMHRAAPVSRPDRASSCIRICVTPGRYNLYDVIGSRSFVEQN